MSVPCLLVDRHSALSQDNGASKLEPKPLDLPSLLSSWRVALNSEHKSPATLKVYTDGITGFLRWCEKTGTPAALNRHAVQAFTAALLDAGAEPATARSRQLALKRLSAWLTEEGELDADPLLGLKPPKLDTKVTDSLTEKR
jgi:site-specific recombinase XerD